MNTPVIANEVKQSMTAGLHGLPRCARSDELPVQGPCAVSGRYGGLALTVQAPCVVSGQARNTRNDDVLSLFGVLEQSMQSRLK